MSRLELGDLAAHVVTGFTGIVTAKVEYLEGCQQVCLQPRELQADGEPKKSRYFDEPYVDLVERAAVPPRVINGQLVDDSQHEVVPLRAAGPSDAPTLGRTDEPPR